MHRSQSSGHEIVHVEPKSIGQGFHRRQARVDLAVLNIANSRFALKCELVWLLRSYYEGWASFVKYVTSRLFT